MAGIGFNLKQVLKKDTYIGTFQGYFYGAVISSGPWILTVASLLALNIWSESFLDKTSRDLFQGTITFNFAFSLIFTGIFQMTISRYIADQLYEKDFTALFSSFVFAALLILIFQGIIGGLFWFSSPYSWIFKILALQLYLITSLLWLVLLYISATNDYEAVTMAFVIGCLISFFAGGMGGKYYGVNGLLGGFVLGETVTLVFLIYRLLVEFPMSPYLNGELLDTFKEYPYLIYIGLVYNIAIWIDKMVFWWGPGSVKMNYIIRFNPLYDNASFVTFLSVIPAIALFVVRVETSFYLTFKNFYNTILGQKSLKEIHKAKEDLIEKVRLSLIRLLKLQGSICFCLVVFAPYWVEWLGMKWLQVTLVRFLSMGACFHILFFLIILFLLYFDLQKVVLILTITFAISNGIGSWITCQLDPRFYGLGYLVSSFIHYLIGWQVLFYELNRLEYITFVLQSAEK